MHRRFVQASSTSKISYRFRYTDKSHKWRTHQEVAEAVTEEEEVEEEEHPEAEAEAVVEASLRFTTQESWNPVPLHNALRVVCASPELSLISQYAGGFGDRGGRGGARGRGAPRARGRGAPRGGGGARGGAKTIVVSIPTPYLLTSIPCEILT